MRALLLENIHPSATEGFARAGIDVETRPGSLSEDELVAPLPGLELLGIRSNTFLTDRALAAATDLVAVGAFCIGTNQIDLASAARPGGGAAHAPDPHPRSGGGD